MKNYILLIIFLLCLGACKKDELTAGDFHLVEIAFKNSAENTLITYEYDGSGRVQKTVYSNNNSLPYRITDIVYNGNEVLIKPPLGLPFDAQNKVIYVLDSLKRPVQRNSLHDFSFANAPNGPQINHESDSSRYEYAADGKIVKYSGVSNETISSYRSPGQSDLQTNTITYTGIYEIDNQNLKSISSILKREFIYTFGSYSRTLSQTIEERTDFIYDKLYPNQFDFKNAYIIRELGNIPFAKYFFNPGFRNFPNKAITTRIIKDNTGIIETTSNTEEPALDFDSKGYLLSMKDNNQAIPKQVFSYKKF